MNVPVIDINISSYGITAQLPQMSAFDPERDEQGFWEWLITLSLFPHVLIACAYSKYDYWSCVINSGYLFLEGIGVYKSSSSSADESASQDAIAPDANQLSNAELQAKMQNDPDIEMINLLETMPNFEQYNEEHEHTKTIKEYWSTSTIGGGPLTRDINTMFTPDIKNPLLNLISTSTNYGYYEIQRIQSSKKLANMFYDVWIMSTELEDVGRLVDLNSFKGVSICCMWHDGWDVATHLNGIARIIWYEDSKE